MWELLKIFRTACRKLKKNHNCYTANGIVVEVPGVVIAFLSRANYACGSEVDRNTIIIYNI